MTEKTISYDFSKETKDYYVHLIIKAKDDKSLYKAVRYIQQRERLE